MIRKREEPEKTISGLIKTVFDWDNLDLIEEARELLSNIYEPSVQKTPRWVGELRVNKFGEIVHPPIEPEEPDTSNWKRITPKRSALLQQYRIDKAQYEMDMEEWLELPLLHDGRTPLEHRLEFLRNRPVIDYGINKRTYYDYINGTFDPEVPTLVYYVKKYGEVRVTAFPVTKIIGDEVKHTEIEFCEVEEGDWVQRDIYDPVWRRENQEVLRKWKRQHRRDFIRNQPDSTVQTTLTNNCWDAREVTASILFTFEGEDTELARKYLDSLMDYGVPVLNGKYRIPDIYVTGTPQEIEELSRRARRVRGQSL